MEKEIVVLSKRSDSSFLDALLSNGSGIINLLYTTLYRKIDKIIVSKNFVSVIIRNKVESSVSFHELETLLYDSKSDTLHIKADGKESEVSLRALRISYEEIKIIR